MPRGIGRPYNKDLRTLEGGSFKGSGLSGMADAALRDKRDFGSRTDFQEMRERERVPTKKNVPLKTGPENPRKNEKKGMLNSGGADPNWKKGNTKFNSKLNIWEDK